MARGQASLGTLAHVVVSKFDHHLPLYRQAQMMASQGIEIDRSTLAGRVGEALVLLEPQAYIGDVMAKIAGYWSAARSDELMPWNWRSDQQLIEEAA